MVATSRRLVLLLSAVCFSSGQQLTATFLKQATDSLLDPLAPPRLTGFQYVRVPAPGRRDLFVRRLQARLEAQVEDNWKALNEPQRWAILRDTNPVLKIIKSFQRLKEEIERAEGGAALTMVKGDLENIDIQSLGQRGVTWIHYLDSLKNYVWQISEQRYAEYFKRYIESPETSVKQGLNDFVTSLVMAKFEDSSLKNLLNNFHRDLFKKNETLFVFLKSVFDEVR